MSNVPDPNAAFRRALTLQKSGNAAEAAKIYRRLVRSLPGNPQILFLLGTAEMQLGNVPESIALFERSLKLAPNQPRALCNMGTGLQNLGRFDEALACYDRAITLDPSGATAFNNRGNTLLSLGRQDEALAGFERAIALQPAYPEAHNNRGIVLGDLKRRPEALAAFERAVALRPDFVKAHCNRGSILNDLDRYDEALACFDRTLALDRDYALAYLGRGTALFYLDRTQEAMADLDHAITLDPGNAKMHCTRAIALYHLGRLKESLAGHDRAAALDPALAETRWNKSQVKLTLGDFASGWELHEWRWKTPAFKSAVRNFTQPVWLGDRPVAGKTVLVYTEQGYGDTIHFCRYVPMLRALGANVVLEERGRLLPLLRTLKGEFTFAERGEPLAGFDLHCSVMSLPLAFKTTLDNVPAEIPYLFADPQKEKEVAGRLGDKLRPRIGLAWSGNSDQSKDRSRSLPLKRFEPLLLLPAFEFHSLQKEVRPDDAAAMTRFPQLRPHQDEQNDFSDAAALIAAMDLVITVDTVIAHLAGAMGKKVWVLLSWMPDWRWLLDRSDSPWYPTATLFRQPERGDWDSVMRAVKNRLHSEPPL